MKRAFIIMALVSASAFAEPSFNQIESLITSRQYGAAQSGLEQITQNHPQSAKAFYAMAQAKAGLGNQIGAKESLDRAIGLDPELKFADKNEVQKLQIAVTPRSEDIKPVNEAHFPFDLLFVLILAAICLWFVRLQKLRQAAILQSKPYGESNVIPQQALPRSAKINYSESKVSSVGLQPSTSSKNQPQIINNYASSAVGSSGDGLLTGILLGNMLSSGREHEITREVIREVPANSNNHSNNESFNRVIDTDSLSSSWDSGSSGLDSSWGDSGGGSGDD